ncbi:hypothetical protein [Methanopyrus sp.]
MYGKYYRKGRRLVSNAFRVRMDFDVLRKEDFRESFEDEDEARRRAREEVEAHLEDDEFAFQVNTVVYSTGGYGEPVKDGWEGLSDRARVSAAHRAVRIGLEELGFTGYAGRYRCDRDFFQVCYGGEFDGDEVPYVYRRNDWEEIREEVLRRLGDRRGTVKTRLGLVVRARPLRDGTVLVSADPKAEVVTENTVRDLVRANGPEWAKRVLPGTYVVPEEGGWVGRELKVVDVTPAEEWVGEVKGDTWTVEDLRGYWEDEHGVSVDPETVVTVESELGRCHYPDDVLRWKVPAHSASEYFRLGPADRIGVGGYVLRKAFERFERKYPGILDHREHRPRYRVQPEPGIVTGGSGVSDGKLFRHLREHGPYEGAGELDGETVDLVAERDLRGLLNWSEGKFERVLRCLLEDVVEALREYFHHDVRVGSVRIVDDSELPESVGTPGPKLVGIVGDRTYADAKLEDPLCQCFTDRTLGTVDSESWRYAILGLATGVHCKHAGQPYAVKTDYFKNALIVGFDVSRKVEDGSITEGRACCSCLFSGEDGTVEHGLTFTTPVGERGEGSPETVRIALERAIREVDAPKVVYLRDGRVPKDELRIVRDWAEERDVDLTVVEVVKSDPTVYGGEKVDGIGFPPTRACVRLDGRTFHLTPPYKLRWEGEGKPGTPRPILVRVPEGSTEGIARLLSDLRLSNWGSPSGVGSRLPAPLLYADRAARLARYGVSVDPRSEESRRPWPV